MYRNYNHINASHLQTHTHTLTLETDMHARTRGHTRTHTPHHFLICPVVSDRKGGLSAPLHRVQVEQHCDVPAQTTHTLFSRTEVHTPTDPHSYTLMPRHTPTPTHSHGCPLTDRRSQTGWSCWLPGGCGCRRFRGTLGHCHGGRGNGPLARNARPAGARSVPLRRTVVLSAA